MTDFNPLDHLPPELRTVSQSGLVVMVYDEILEALGTAVEAVRAGDIEARCNAITVASDLIAHLYLALDSEQGGEIAQNLGSIYNFILTRLPQVNLANLAAPAEEAISLLEPLRVSWHDLDGRITAGEVPGFVPEPAFAQAASRSEG